MRGNRPSNITITHDEQRSASCCTDPCADSCSRLAIDALVAWREEWLTD